METFEYSDFDFTYSVPINEVIKTRFEENVENKWGKAMSSGLFRYSLNHMKTRIVFGEKKYVLQLNEKRMRERRKPETFLSCDTPFDKSKFNFTKINPSEILFKFRRINDLSLDGDHFIMINVSPLEKNHILLVPNINKCFPQRLDVMAIQLSIEFLLLTSNPAWRIGFNSLCALASVNHQHLHAWTLEHRIYLEHVKVRKLSSNGKNLHILEDGCRQALAFQLHGSAVGDLAKGLFETVELLHSRNIPHNLFMTRGESFDDKQLNTIRVFVFPRKLFDGCKFDSIKLQAFNVACAELSGHVPIYDLEAYEALTEGEIEEIIKREMIPKEEFNELVQRVHEIL